MFIKQVMKRNPGLVETAFDLHKQGLIEPDSYLIDMDSLSGNAGSIRKKADEYGFKLYFMLKQLGRNPVIAKELMRLGYDGAVVVDYKEAGVMMEAGITIGNVGNLVQIPEAQIEKIMTYGAEVITVFSLEKIKSINRVAEKLGLIQGILIRVYGDGDMIYSGQTAGFHTDELSALAELVQREYKHVRISGVTSFPCYLYQEALDDVTFTSNLSTVLLAEQKLKKSGISCEIINTPSTNCCHTIDLMSRYGGNCAEAGHGLSGTTPMHANHEMEEIPCVVYVSEISHNFKEQGYCFGGGHYRRSHVNLALVGKSPRGAELMHVIPPSDESIDYYFGLEKECHIGDTAVMAFRFQMFVTRSDVVLVKGIQTGRPEIIGIYDSLGRRK